MIAAFLLAALVGQAGPAAPSAPAYSLVTARERGWRVGGEHTCVGLSNGHYACARDPSAWYADATSLAGRPVAPDQGTSNLVGSAGWYRPVLLLIRWDALGVPVVVAQAQADASGRACIPAAELDRLGWHPTGLDIAAAEGGVCASLSVLAALPVPEQAAITAVSASDVRVHRREERRGRGNRRN